MLLYQDLMDVTNILCSLQWSLNCVTMIWLQWTWSLPSYQVISAPVYSAVVSVCFLVWHLDFTLVHPLPVCVIKPSLTITAWVQSRCKHPYLLLPSPSWIIITHSDLGNEFPFRYRDNGDDFLLMFSFYHCIYILPKLYLLFPPHLILPCFFILRTLYFHIP